MHRILNISNKTTR